MSRAKRALYATSVLGLGGSIAVFLVSAATAQPATAPAGQQPAADQEQPGAKKADKVEKVTVTARRRREAIQDVPGVVQAFTGAELEQQGASGIEDIVGMTPGVEFVNSTGEPGSNDLVIRGAGAGRFLNTDSPVGLYQNGAYVSGGNIGGRTLNESDLFDLERVEVLKGPQGALLGRNALGGSVNAISRRPGLDAIRGSIVAGVQQAEGGSIEGALEAPIAVDEVGLRVAGRFTSRSDGFFFNPYLDRYTDRYSESIARAVLRARPSKTVDVVFQVDYYDIERAGSLVSDLDVVKDPYSWSQDDENRGFQTQNSYFAGLGWDLGFGSFNASASFRDRDGRLVEDLDQGVASPLPFDATKQNACIPATAGAMPTPAPSNQRCLADATDFFEQTTLQAYLQGETGMFNWIIGADYLKGDDVYRLDRTGLGNTGSVTVRTTNEVASAAFWGGLEMRPIDPLSLGVELRYTDEEKNQSSRATFIQGPAAGTDAFNNSLNSQVTQTTWAAFARYEFSDDASVYTRVGTGFRSGGLNTDARDLTNPATGLVAVVPDAYLPEKATSYEAGVRTEWLDDTLFANATVFLIEYTDLLQNLNNGLTGVNRIQYVFNTGDAEVTGVELEFGGRSEEFLGGNLKWSFGAVNASSEIVSGPSVGLEVTRLPEWSLSGRAFWRRGIGGAWDALAGLRYTQQWGGFTSANNSTPLQEPQVFHLTLGVENPDWTFALTVNNLTDEDEPYNETSANLFSPREPRNWTLRLTRRFGEE